MSQPPMPGPPAPEPVYPLPYQPPAPPQYPPAGGVPYQPPAPPQYPPAAGVPYQPPAAPQYQPVAPAPYQPPAPPPYPPAVGLQTGGAPGIGRPPAANECRLCGSAPAAKVTFRGHTGMLIIARFSHLQGPFCRDCGLATFRKMTANTLLVGWWGWISFIATPITVLINLFRRGKVANLAAPHKAPDVVAPLAAPLSPGKPVLARPQAWVGLVIVLVVLCFLISAIAQGGS